MLNNTAVKALTTEDEIEELAPVVDAFKLKHHNPNCTFKHPLVKFAYWQNDLEGGKIAYWHVMTPGHASYHSSLSMTGLIDWGIFK